MNNSEIEREDLVLFINAAITNTGQKEFYSDASEQTLDLDFLHKYILINYRKFYARMLTLQLNDYNKAKIIQNLLAYGRLSDKHFRSEENALLTAGLKSLPPQRVFKLFVKLRYSRINNRRTRTIIRCYLLNRPDPIFDTLKYRRKIREAVAHAHLKLPGEANSFLFKGWNRKRYATALFEKYRQAHFSKKAVYDLPYTIAEGLAAKHGIKRSEFLKNIQKKMTTNEKLLLQTTAEREQVKIVFDLGKAPLTKLILYMLSLSFKERSAKASEFKTAIADSVAKVLKKSNLHLPRVATVLDRSYSMSGSSEKKRRPLAVVLACHYLLHAISKEYLPFWTLPIEDELLITATGQSNLAVPLINALETSPDLLVIVSDGFENAPFGGVSEIIRVFKKKLDPADKTNIIHFNPVFDPHEWSPKGLSKQVATVGIRNGEDLPKLIPFALFSSGKTSMEQFDEFLQQQVANFLEKYGVKYGEEHCKK